MTRDGRKGRRTGLRTVRWTDTLVPGLPGRVQTQYDRRQGLVREAVELKARRQRAERAHDQWVLHSWSTLFGGDEDHRDLSDDELLELVEVRRRDLTEALEALAQRKSKQRERGLALLDQLEALSKEESELEVLLEAQRAWNELAPHGGQRYVNSWSYLLSEEQA